MTTNENQNQNQQSHLFSNYARWPLAIVRGEGHYVWDQQGKKYLDFVSGIAVTSLGHVPPAVKARIQAQLDTLWHSSNLFQHPLQEQLAGELCALSGGLDRVLFVNSGAEANEAAIKLVRRYMHSIRGQKERYEIITFEQSFHGRTLATLTATGQAKVKDGFSPLPEGFITVPYQDMASLKQAVTPGTAAIMLELVQGEGGVNPADANWIKQVKELCEQHELLLVIDEVQTGIGRTGTWFAYQQYDILPDIVTIAKGLGSGFPVGAIMAREYLAEAFSPGTHGTTFGGNPLAMAAGLGTLETIRDQGILDQVQRSGTYFMQKLSELKQHSPLVKEVRGRGLLIGVSMTVPVARVIELAREKGVLLLSAGTNVLRILPPLTVTTQEIDHAVSVLASVLEAVQKEAQSNSADGSEEVKSPVR